MDSPISWNPQLCIGEEEIDQQHRKLFDFADRLYTFCTNTGTPANKKEIELFLNEATSYAKYHFSYEEQIMKEIRYPQLITHVKRHHEFIAEVSENLIAFSHDKHLSLEPFYEYITKWLIDHITKEDACIAQFLHPQGSEYSEQK